MPQISQRPPPYSRDRPSFPPPLQNDVHHRAWAFQLAFENARELVRWTVLKTFEEWKGDWRLKGKEVAKEHVQQTYDQAPEELKLAVDWQLQWDIPAIMCTPVARRWHEHVRRQEAGTYEEILAPEKFEREFEAAPSAVQQAVLSTFPSWKWTQERIIEKKPRRDELLRRYRSSDQKLKAVLCFMLEMASDLPFSCEEDMSWKKAVIKELVEEQRADAHSWNLDGKNAGFW